MKVHGDTVMENSELRAKAKRIEEAVRQSWSRMDDLLQNVRCAVGFLAKLQG